MKLDLNDILILFAIMLLKKIVDYKSFERKKQKTALKLFFLFFVFIDLFDTCIERFFLQQLT